MSGFTPGPWIAEFVEQGCVIRPRGTGYLLAALSADSFTYDADLPEGPPHDLEANARLIAEAPTLHDLLLTTIWVKKSDGQQYCHRCLAGRAEGHTADCELDAVFRRIGSETGTG